MARKIILFELNEVPYRVLDEFRVWRPRSAFARALPRCRQYETFTEDRSDLSPWRTWPSLHRGVNDEQHLIHDFGQDLDEVDRAYPPVWRILARGGVSTGVCGSLHSYPVPADLNGYSFFLPDTFAAGSECFPAALGNFQELNLRMARESGRNVDTHVPWAHALRFLAAAPDLGLKARTVADVGLQLVSEKLQGWRTTRRRTYQAVLAFDIFLGQLLRTKPAFSTFFTNHVASSMHRYWAATFPGDYQEFGYDRKWVATYRNEIDFTMNKFDGFFARLVSFVERNPDYVLWVATSMGQAATTALPLETQLYVTDLGKLASALGLRPEDWSVAPAMRPQANLRVTPSRLEEFRSTLESLRIDGRPILHRQRENGFLSLEFGHKNLHLVKEPFVTLDGRVRDPGELGLGIVEIEDKSGATAYHVPNGALLVYDPTARAAPSAERTQVSTLELAPTILRNFALPIPGYMRQPAGML